MSTFYKSLFLPLKADEKAIFSSYCVHFTLLHKKRSETGDGRRLPSAREPSPTSLYSPAEGGDSLGLDTSSHTASPYESPSLLSLLCARKSSGMVVVLENGGVIYYSLKHPRGPVELARVLPPPAVNSVHQASPNHPVRATCASLVHSVIAYTCRLGYHGGEQGPTTAFYRVVVGFANGRVSVVTEQGYSFGFAAHDCPIVEAHLLYTSKQDPAEGGEGTSAAAATLEKSSRDLSFLTCGEDGRVFLWKRRMGNMKPTMVLESAPFFRKSAFCLYAPPPVDLGWFTEKAVVGEASLLMPHATLLHSGPRRKGLYARLLCEEGDSVELEGSALLVSSPTAMCTNGDIILVGCKQTLYYIGVGHANPMEKVFVATEEITHICMDGPLVVVGCGGSGIVNFFCLQSGSPPMSRLGEYYSYHNRRVVHLSVDAPSMSVVMVDVAGSVEVVRLPTEYADAILSSSTVPLDPVLEHFPAARALHGRCRMDEVEREIEDRKEGGEGPPVTRPPQEELAMLEKRQRMVERLCTLEESVLLARMSMPLSCNEYMHKSAPIK